MNTANIIEMASILSVAITAVFAMFQWSGSMKIKRSEIIHDLLDTIRSNPDIRDAWYYLEYHEDKWYDDSFHGTELESKIDYLLAHLNYITFLIETKVIKKNEFELFDYQIHAVSRNFGIQCYFYNLYHYAQSNGSTFSFQCLFDYCIRMGYLDPDILDRKCGNYNVSSFNSDICCVCDSKNEK